MKRRTALKSLLGAPAAAAVPAAAQTSAPASEQMPKLALVTPDAVANGTTRFCSPEQRGALTRLGEILVPPFQGRPGATEAEAPEFLDFLLSQSPAERQALYRNGLDQLNREARRTFGKPFSEISAEQAQGLLTPLTERWTYASPKDPFARFLRQAKDDILQATMNSRQWAQSSRRRGAAGMGTYWYTIE